MIWKRDPAIGNGFVPTELWRFVRQIKSPIIYVIGRPQHDRAGSKRRRNLRKTLPQAEIVTIPGVGHYPSEEKPAEFLAIVDKFLLQVSKILRMIFDDLSLHHWARQSRSILRDCPRNLLERERRRPGNLLVTPKTIGSTRFPANIDWCLIPRRSKASAPHCCTATISWTRTRTRMAWNTAMSPSSSWFVITRRPLRSTTRSGPNMGRVMAQSMNFVDPKTKQPPEVQLVQRGWLRSSARQWRHNTGQRD